MSCDRLIDVRDSHTTAWAPVLFDPMTNGLDAQNAEGLAEAIMRGLKLAQHPETAAACRAHAHLYSPSRIGPQIEAVYRSIC